MIDVKALLAWPSSTLGKWAVYCILGFLGCMILFFILIQTGQKGGETFFDNLVLAIPLLVASACGIASSFLSFAAIVMQKERILILLFSFFVGSFILWFTVVEIIGHE
jgi:hypothetical protein